MDTSIIVALISGGVSVVVALLQIVTLRKQNTIQAQNNDTHERMVILLEGVEASLIGVKQLGANGRVTAALHELESYKNKKAAD